MTGPRAAGGYRVTPLGAGGRFGLWFGLHAWLLVILGLFFWTWDLALLTRVILPGIALSSGMAAASHLLVLGASVLRPGDHGMRTLVFIGAIWLSIGVLSQAMARTFLPEMQKLQEARQLLGATGSVNAPLADWLGIIALASGAVFLGLALRRVGHGPPAETAQPAPQ